MDLKVLWIDVMEIVWVAILSATVNSYVEINAIEQTHRWRGRPKFDSTQVNSAGGDDDDGEGPRVPWGEGRWAEPLVDEGGAVSR